MVTKPIPRVWVRVAKERMESGHYTVFRSSGWFQLWYGISDQYHYGKDLGRFCTADEAYVAAERHAQTK